MSILFLNGSPRKDGNTAILIEKAMEGAKAAGADVKRIDLFDLNYKGCISCFSCLRKGGKSLGRCAVKDDLQAVLREIESSDGLVIGSPIYFGDLTGQVRNLLERLMFQYLMYEPGARTVAPMKIPIGMIYTMNCPDASFYDNLFAANEGSINTFVGPVIGRVAAVETLQFDDYSKYAAGMISEEARRERREKVFWPVDCENARALGEALAKWHE